MSFREDLMAALETAVTHYNQGMTDNEAVIKAASGAEFNVDQTQRLVESFNTAKSIYFFKVADDRRAAFTLAEMDKVLPAMFKPEDKATAKPSGKAASAGLYDYSAYSVPEPHFDGQFSLELGGARAYEWSAVKASFDFTLDGLYRSLQRHVKTARQTSERCANSADLCDVRYGQCLNKLAEFIRQDYHEPARAAEVEHYYWALSGSEIAGPVTADLFSCLVPAYQDKRASADQEGLPSDFDSRHPDMAALVEESVTARFGACRMRALAQEFGKEADEMMIQWNEITGLRPAEPDAVEEMMTTRIAKRAQALPTPKAPSAPRAKAPAPSSPLGSLFGAGMKVIGGGMAEGVKKPLAEATGELFGGAGEQEEAKFTERLRNLQRQLILEDLVVNDPILEGANPQAVATAYQTLIRLAPDVSLNKEIVRSVVRASVNAISMSPFDAKAIAELENELHKQLTGGREASKKR